MINYQINFYFFKKEIKIKNVKSVKINQNLNEK